MRGSEIAGAVAIAGVVVMIALSLADGNEPAVRNSPAGSTESAQAGFAGTTTSTSDQSTTSTAASARATTVPVNPAVPSSTTPEPVADTPTPPTTVPQASTSESPNTLSVAERAAVRVRALNGGASKGAAGQATDVLEEAGFAPLSPADAWQHIDVPGRILFRSGADLAAITMAQVLGYAPEHVTEGDEDDDNWRHFAEDVDVLVIVGPS